MVAVVAAEAGVVALIGEGGSYLWTQGARLWASEVAGYKSFTWSKALYGMGSNGVSQLVANKFDWRKVNGIEMGMSAFGTYSSTIFGETFSFSKEDGFQTPKSWDHAMLQIGGGIFSTYFGNKLGDYKLDSSISGSFTGQFYKETSKFIIETASNIAPNFGDTLHPELEKKK